MVISQVKMTPWFLVRYDLRHSLDSTVTTQCTHTIMSINYKFKQSLQKSSFVGSRLYCICYMYNSLTRKTRKFETRRRDHCQTHLGRLRCIFVFSIFFSIKNICDERVRIRTLLILPSSLMLHIRTLPPNLPTP